LQRGQARRWRRLALGGAVAAAVLLACLALRVELHWHEQQLIIGWGSPPAPVSAPGAIVDKPVSPAPANTDLEVLRDLVHAIAAEQRSVVRRAELAQLEDRVDKLAAASRRDWNTTQNHVRALYTAYIRSKGDIP
jgi:hypothetical protein